MVVNIKDILTIVASNTQFEITNFSIDRHVNAALEWIVRAQDVAGDGGISKGYQLLCDRWAPSYPETTGYSIPTLLNSAIVLTRPDLASRAMVSAKYLLRCLTPEGGVVHWQDRAQRKPIVFDTGQVIFGLIAAYESTQEDSYLQAAIKAGNWLISIQDSSGAWKSNQFLDVEKVIDTRVDWALLQLYKHTNQESLVIVANRNLKWVQSKQNEVGWFANCSFLPKDDPFTHTLAYTAEGLWECSYLLNESKYRHTALWMADALLARQRSDGSLASTYRFDWRETSRSSCLTGNCQMARLWLRIFEENGDTRYLTAARRAIIYTAAAQNMSTNLDGVNGAIAGSSPIYGKYERFKYPNWAVKFFIDALLELDRIEKGKSAPPYLG